MNELPLPYATKTKKKADRERHSWPDYPRFTYDFIYFRVASGFPSYESCLSWQSSCCSPLEGG
jgi:hypothetical protein